MADEIEPVADETVEAPVSETPVEAVETPEVPAEPAAPPEPDYFSILKEKAGVDFSGKYKTPEELFKGIGHLAQRVGQKTELERQGELAARHWDQFQQYLQSQQQPAQPQQPAHAAQQQAPFWNPPEVKPTDKRWVSKDPETGVSRINPDAPLDVRQRLEQYATYFDEYQYNLQNNPTAILQPWADQVRQQTATEVEQRILAFLQQRDQQQAQQQTLQGIKGQREKLVFQFDASGNRIIDPSGVPTVTEYGRHYVIRVKELEAMGIYDPSTQDRLAHEHADLQVRLSAAPGTRPAPQPKPGQAASKSTPPSKGPAKTSLAEMLLADNADIPDDADVVNVVFS